MIRNSHAIGDYLMVDGESGFTHLASEMVQRWDGVMVHWSNNEPRHPQEFVRAKNDPIALRVVRERAKVSAACGDSFDLYVPNTTIPILYGPATHLFDKGIGEAEIECNFVVR